MKLQDWAHWAEIVASFAVVLSIVFLTIQVAQNTRVLEQQAVDSRSATINGPFVNSPQIPSILAKIKAVDGPETLELAYMERYGLTYEEAGIWARQVQNVINGLESEFLRVGSSQSLTDRVQLLMLYPDVQLVWETGAVQVSNTRFREFFAEAIEAPRATWIEEWEQELERAKSR